MSEPTTIKKKICASIMVVEDQEDLRDVIVEILKMEGYSVFSSINGKEALDLLKEIPKPCLILLDMMMPVMNGREFLDTLLVDATLTPIPVLFVSAFDNLNTKGAIGVLKKPIDIEALLRIVQQYCSLDC